MAARRVRWSEWLRLWLREPCQCVSARVRFCPDEHEALAPPTDARASGSALSAMAYAKVSVLIQDQPHSIRKPLLYPSELRGHGRATIARTASLERGPEGYHTRKKRLLAMESHLTRLVSGASNVSNPGRLSRP